jgi:hypothetical protein
MLLKSRFQLVGSESRDMPTRKRTGGFVIFELSCSSLLKTKLLLCEKFESRYGWVWSVAGSKRANGKGEILTFDPKGHVIHGNPEPSAISSIASITTSFTTRSSTHWLCSSPCSVDGHSAASPSLICVPRDSFTAQLLTADRFYLI